MKLLSLWSFAALIALLALQAIPATGPRLHDLGTPVVAGCLVHVSLFCLLFESLTNRLPRIVVVLPIFAYTGYYAAFWQQAVHTEERSRELKASNPGRMLVFDSQTYSLVMDHAAEFVATHAIPVAYTLDLSYRPESYQSYRLTGVVQAAQAVRDAATEMQIFAVYQDEAKLQAVRELRIPERPPNRIVSVAARTEPGGGWQDWNIGEEITEISLEGKPLGSFKLGYVWRLPTLPFLAIGCRFPEGAARKCYIELALERKPLDSMPDYVDQALFDDPVSVMLGVRTLDDREFRTGKTFALKIGSSDASGSRPPKNEQAAFDALEAVLGGQPPDLPTPIIVQSLVGDPDRLAPLAASMADRFVELNRSDRADIPGQPQQSKILASALAALPAAAIGQVSQPLQEVLRRADAWAQYPELYVRLADAGPGLYPFYRDRFLAPETTQTERLLAALAICRIGQVDSELASALKSQFSANDPKDSRGAEYESALFVALLKLGQDDFLRTAARSDASPLQSWYDALLAGKGKSAVGPNNCLSWEWPWPEYLPPPLTPRLRWAKGSWEGDERK